MSMSSVPWITSVLGASIKASLFSAHLDCQDVIARPEAGRPAIRKSIRQRCSKDGVPFPSEAE
jgi:hypothetical protein